MSDVEGLYIVTGVVLAALVVWVVVVLARAPNAVDRTKPPAPPQPPPPVPDEPSDSDSEDDGPSDASATPPPAVSSVDSRETEGAPREEPAAAAASEDAPARAKAEHLPTMLGLAAPEPVVKLGEPRGRLGSHPEIQDGPPSSGPVVLMPEVDVAAKGSDALVLVTAVSVGDPSPERLAERHAILDRHHLVVFADGSGKRAGEDLASAIVVDTVSQAFENDDPAAFADDPKLPERANRIRRAVLAANRELLRRAGESGRESLAASVLAAYFSPDHRELFVAHVGASRAYCIRNGHVARLTTPHGARTLGVADAVDVEIVEESVRAGDAYLFCSDALGRALSETDLVESLTGEPTLDGVTRRLVETAKANEEEPQNLVAVVVRVDAAPEGPKIRQRAPTVVGLG